MKIKLILWCLWYSFFVQSTWKIGTIHNNSDIVFNSAHYIQPQEKEITVLSENIKKQIGSKKVSINYTVSNSSNGCCLIKGLVQGSKDSYTLVFDGGPAHSLGRSQAKKGVRNKRFECKDHCKFGSYCARVFLDIDKKDGTSEQIACHGLEYPSIGTILHVVVTKNGNSYSVLLKTHES